MLYICEAVLLQRPNKVHDAVTLITYLPTYLPTQLASYTFGC